MFARGAFRTIVGLSLLLPGVARASFHFMQIEQVIGGVNGDVTAQAIQLRMRSGGQNQVSFARLRAWDAAGANPVLVVDFAGNVTNALAGDRILIATPSFVAATSPNAVPNFFMANPIPAGYLAAGSLTFEQDGGPVYWRLSWGGAGYTGSTTGDSTNDDDPGVAPANFGPPFAGPLPSASLQALRFTGAATALSTSNLADYALTPDAAVFVNNARASFSVIAPQPVPGDVDGDRDVDLFDYLRCAACLTGPNDATAPSMCAPSEFPACDLNVDNHVDLADFADLLLLMKAAL